QPALQSAYAFPIFVISEGLTAKPVLPSKTTCPKSLRTKPKPQISPVLPPALANKVAVPLVAIICSSLPKFSLKLIILLSFFAHVDVDVQVKFSDFTGEPLK